VHRVRPATVAAAVPTPTIAFHRWPTRVQLLPAGNCPHPDNPDGVGIPDMALENCILPFVCDYKSLCLSVSTTLLRTLVSSPVSHLSCVSLSPYLSFSFLSVCNSCRVLTHGTLGHKYHREWACIRWFLTRLSDIESSCSRFRLSSLNPNSFAWNAADFQRCPMMLAGKF
jgi:hypothetical protein